MAGASRFYLPWVCDTTLAQKTVRIASWPVTVFCRGLERKTEMGENIKIHVGVICYVFFISGAFLGFGAVWNLCSMTFDGGVDRRILGLLRCRTNEP